MVEFVSLVGIVTLVVEDVERMGLKMVLMVGS